MTYDESLLVDITADNAAHAGEIAIEIAERLMAGNYRDKAEAEGYLFSNIQRARRCAIHNMCLRAGISTLHADRLFVA